MELTSLNEIIDSANSEADFLQRISVVQTELQWAVAKQQDLTYCAIWLKNSIDAIASIEENGKIIRNDGIRLFALESLKDLYQECLSDVQKLLIADPSKI